MSDKQRSRKIYYKMAVMFCLAATVTSLWISVIFGFSSANGEKSASQSHNVVQGVVRIVDKDYVMPEKPEPKSMDQVFDTIVRKTAHTCVYAVLGILMYLTVKTLTLAGNTYWGAKLSIPLSILVAIGDEYNQTLTEGRSGRLYDVVIDSVGIVIGTMLCIWIIGYVLKKRRQIKKA